MPADAAAVTCQLPVQGQAVDRSAALPPVYLRLMGLWHTLW
jgi:hypothetical protein